MSNRPDIPGPNSTTKAVAKLMFGAIAMLLILTLIAVVM